MRDLGHRYRSAFTSSLVYFKPVILRLLENLESLCLVQIVRCFQPNKELYFGYGNRLEKYYGIFILAPVDTLIFYMKNV